HFEHARPSLRARGPPATLILPSDEVQPASARPGLACPPARFSLNDRRHPSRAGHSRPRPPMTPGSLATRWNLDALEAASQRCTQDPASVDESWRHFFEGFELGAARTALPAFDARAQIGVVRLIDAYRDLGHFLAHLDPLSERRTSFDLLELSQ